MKKGGPLASRSLSFEVVFWDSEAPGYEGNRIRFSEKDTSSDAVPAWRSDRRCRFPIEIGLRLDSLSRLREVSVMAEAGLTSSAVEFFVAGPARREKAMSPKKRTGARQGRPTKVSESLKRADYVSSVFVKIGRAEFSHASERGSSTVSVMSASLSELSFKCQFLRLVLWEPPGSYANPGRQVSVTRIRVVGSVLEAEPPQGLKVPRDSVTRHPSCSRGELEGVLMGLGIEPTLAHGVDEGGAQRAAEIQAVDHDCSLDGDIMAVAMMCEEGGGDGEGIEVPRPASEAVKTVQGMLQVARMKEKFHEAERVSLVLTRVRSLGATLHSSRLAQESASLREDFEQAKMFRDKAREAEAWLEQAVRDASVILDGTGSARDKENRNSSDPGVVSLDEARSSDVDAPVQKPSKEEEATPSSEGNRLPEESTAQTPLQPLSLSPSSALADSSNSQSGNKQGPDAANGAPHTALEPQRTPPWMNPGCPRSIEPWQAAMRLPWPAGVFPEFTTVFSHAWAGDASGEKNKLKGGRGGGRPDGMVTAEIGRSRGRRPGGLLGTIVRLVAASQDLRPPGPVPPDVAPFRLAGTADSQAPLSSFSTIGVGEGEGSKSRAYAHLATDDTPSATHVTNWIEDNPRVAWSSFSRRRGVVSACERYGAGFGMKMGVRTVGSAGGSDAGEEDWDSRNSGVEGRGDDGKKAKEALSGVATTAELPNVVGAGGFADFVPLLGAIIGRAPISAACAGFQSKMREASIRVCQSHLDLTADVAVAAYTAATAAARATARPATSCPHSSSRAEPKPQVKRVPSTQTPADGNALIEGQDGMQLLVARGAVVRAGCLVAAQGLMDPIAGPRSAGESLAMSVLCLWSTSGRKDDEEPVADENVFANTTGADGTTQADGVENPDDRPTGKASIDSGGSVGANTLPLRDLRWGLELVLACVALYVSNGEIGGEASDTAAFVDDERGSTVADFKGSSDEANINAAAPESRDVVDRTAAQGGEGGKDNGAEASVKKDDPDEGEEAARTAHNLLDFVCRCPHLGPALVASILVSWIPPLVQWGTPAKLSRETAENARRGMQLGRVHPEEGLLVDKGLSLPSSRPKHDHWPCAPAGEAGASEALASGAINMLIFMVRRFPMVDQSDFSAETLARAAECGMGFGVGNSRSVDRRIGAKRGSTGRGLGVRHGRRLTGGQAHLAGEALMLELFLARGGGGIGVLLPALASARGLSCLHEAPAALIARTTSHKRLGRDGSATGPGETEGKGRAQTRAGKRGGNEVGRKSSAGVLHDLSGAPIAPVRRERVIANVDARPRLALPAIPSSPPRIPPISPDRSPPAQAKVSTVASVSAVNSVSTGASSPSKGKGRNEAGHGAAHDGGGLHAVSPESGVVDKNQGEIKTGRTEEEVEEKKATAPAAEVVAIPSTAVAKPQSAKKEKKRFAFLSGMNFKKGK